jgi:hypothetical protein
VFVARYTGVMDSLYNLLAGKNFEEPREIAAIKDFVRQNYKAEAQVQLRERDILVIVPSAGLASRLRFDMPKLKKAAETEKRIVLRIGS